jgi:hypothetical protein
MRRKKVSEKHAFDSEGTSIRAAQHIGARMIIRLLGSDRMRPAKALSAACNLHRRKLLDRIDAAQYAIEMGLNGVIA